MKIALASIPFMILLIGKLVIRKMDKEIDKDFADLMKQAKR